MEKFSTILTAIGRAKITNAVSNREPLELTEMAVGDGGGAYYTPTENMTALKNEVYRRELNRLSPDPDNPTYMICEMVVPSDAGGFTVREAAIFDAAGDMIAVGKIPETYKPTLEAGAAKDLYIRFVMDVSNAEAVTLKINPSVVLATAEMAEKAAADAVTAHAGQVNPHKQYLFKKDYTADDVLAKMREITGGGEYVNADRIGGLSREDIEKSIKNVGQGRIKLADGVDLNTVVAGGEYYLGAGALNVPPAFADTPGVALYVNTASDGSTFQNISLGDFYSCFRLFGGGVWGDWLDAGLFSNMGAPGGVASLDNERKVKETAKKADMADGVWNYAGADTDKDVTDIAAQAIPVITAGERESGGWLRLEKLKNAVFGSVLPVASGGTGATTAEAARNNLRAAPRNALPDPPEWGLASLSHANSEAVLVYSKLFNFISEGITWDFIEQGNTAALGLPGANCFLLTFKRSNARAFQICFDWSVNGRWTRFLHDDTQTGRWSSWREF